MEQVHPERNEGSIEQPSKAAAVKPKMEQLRRKCNLTWNATRIFKSIELSTNRLGFVPFVRNWVFFVSMHGAGEDVFQSPI